MKKEAEQEKAAAEGADTEHVAEMAGTVPVRFQVDCTCTKAGEHVFVIGSLPELGAWDPAGALECKTTLEAFPIWTSTEQILSLQGHNEMKMEFKVFLKGAQ